MVHGPRPPNGSNWVPARGALPLDSGPTGGMGREGDRKGRGWVAWRVSGLRQELDEPDQEVLARAARTVGVEPGDVRSQRFARRSVDARGRGRDLHFVCQVDLVVPEGPRGPKLRRLLRRPATARQRRVTLRMPTTWQP